MTSIQKEQRNSGPSFTDAVRSSTMTFPKHKGGKTSKPVYIELSDSEWYEVVLQLDNVHVG